jgi:hypothetical protein
MTMELPLTIAIAAAASERDARHGRFRSSASGLAAT